MRTSALKLLSLSILMTAIAGCTRTVKPDAYGNVEAIEVVVGAEATGRLVSFDATEGQQIVADALEIGNVLDARTRAGVNRREKQRRQRKSAEAGHRGAAEQFETSYCHGPFPGRSAEGRAVAHTNAKHVPAGVQPDFPPDQ